MSTDTTFIGSSSSSNCSSELENAMMRMLYAWMKRQNEVIDIEDLCTIIEQTLSAWNALVSEGGVVILSTTVGYTLAALGKNSESLAAVKSRSTTEKPLGILGAYEIFKEIFQIDPPTELLPFVCMGFMKCLPCSICSTRVPKSCMSWYKPTKTCRDDTSHDDRSSDKSIKQEQLVGIWLNLGPIAEYVILRAWNELGEVIVGSSCNQPGDGNPIAAQYTVDALDADIRSRVDYTITFKHWGEPEFDENGKWLSAPILCLERQEFIRNGRDMDVANIVRDAITRDVGTVPENNYDMT